VADPAREIEERSQALARAEQAHGPQDPETIRAHEWLAYAYENANLHEQATPLREQALRQWEARVGPAHKVTASARKCLADNYYITVRFAEGLAAYQLAADQCAKVSGPLKVVTLLARSGAARCLRQMGRFGQAIAEFERLLPDWEAGFGRADRNLLNDRWQLAATWDAAGNAQEAMVQYWRLSSDSERLLGYGDSLTQSLAGNLVPSPRPWHPTQPLGTRSLWLVSLAAIQEARVHDSGMDRLYPGAYLARHHSVTQLESDWGISSRDDLLSMADWLLAEGHRFSMAPRLGHPPVSWDFSRRAFMVRQGYAAEYIVEDEAWQLLEAMAGEVAGSYQSWRDFGEDYLAARWLWQGGADKPGGYSTKQQQTINGISRLLDPSNATSPWNLVPWDAISHPDQPVITADSA
jgi:tetratricopeptide (TPR) repeat protein